MTSTPDTRKRKTCPACASSMYEDMCSDTVQCTLCGLVYTPRVMSDAENQRLCSEQPAAAPKEAIDGLFHEGRAAYFEEDTGWRVFWLRQHFGLALPETYQGATLLNTGCSWGGYLLAAHSLGLRATGYERIPANVAVGQCLGLDIHGESFLEADIPASAFAYAMVDALFREEHPLDCLKKLRHVCMPGGFLLFHVPNWESYAANAIKANRCDPFYNPLFFTIKTLRKMVIDAGFAIDFCHSFMNMDTSLINYRQASREPHLLDGGHDAIVNFLETENRHGRGESILLLARKL